MVVVKTSQMDSDHTGTRSVRSCGGMLSVGDVASIVDARGDVRRSGKRVRGHEQLQRLADVSE